MDKFASDTQAPVADHSATDRLRNESRTLGAESILGRVASAASSVFVDQNTSESAEVNQYIRNGIKTSALFLRGKAGIISSAAVNAFDQMGIDDGIGTQLLDGTLGAIKGVAMRGLFAKTEKLELDVALKAMVLGVGTRVADNALERRNYLDAQSNFQLRTGLETALNTSLNPGALGTDIICFGFAHGYTLGANMLTRNAVANNRLLSNVVSGAALGLTTGANDEVYRQSGRGRFDWDEVARKAVMQAAVDAVAAVPAGIQRTRLRLPITQPVADVQARHALPSAAPPELKLGANSERSPIANASKDVPVGHETVTARLAAGDTFLKNTEWKPMLQLSGSEHTEVHLSDVVRAPISLTVDNRVLHAHSSDYLVRYSDGRLDVWDRSSARNLFEPRFLDQMRKMSEH
jgi:hypothetical protein